MDGLKILQGLRDIAGNQALLQEQAMIVSHRMNLCGLKRLHRHHAKKFYCHGLELENCAQDYGIELKIPAPKTSFNAKDLKEHLSKMVSALETDIEAIKKLNIAAFNQFGMEFTIGGEIQNCLSTMWTKMKNRWLPRFEFTKWSPEDIVSWDKWLHDKTRCTEEHGGGEHNCPYCHQHTK